MGVKKIMEKIHDIGKYMVGGDFFGRFGKIQHTFQGFFPGPPPASMRNFEITFCSLNRGKANLNFDISYIKFGSLAKKL